MAKYMVAVTKVIHKDGKEEIGDIVKSWSYTNLPEARKQFGRVISGLKRHKKNIRYKVEFPNEVWMAQTENQNSQSLWITLTKEET